MIPAVAVAALAAVLPLHAQEKSVFSFTFTKVDLKLLEECDALDRKFESSGLVYHDAGLEKHLADLAAPLLPRAPVDHVKWQFHILRDPMANAFALPNGSVYIDTGLLARAENDDQVAGVLAHEVTHVVNRHTYIFNRSVRKRVVAQEVLSAASAWIPAGSWGVSLTISAAADVGHFAIVDMIYGYSRELEEDADRTGVERMKGAGLDPAQIVRVLEILDDKLEPEPVPPFLLESSAHQGPDCVSEGADRTGAGASAARRRGLPGPYAARDSTEYSAGPGQPAVPQRRGGGAAIGDCVPGRRGGAILAWGILSLSGAARAAVDEKAIDRRRAPQGL